VINFVVDVFGGREIATPAWLRRPGRAEGGPRRSLVRDLYAELTDMDLPATMPPHDRLRARAPGEPPRLIEFDETQHFNRSRAATIRRHPEDLRVAVVQRCG
jgi:hypothetical protein